MQLVLRMEKTFTPSFPCAVSVYTSNPHRKWNKSSLTTFRHYIEEMKEWIGDNCGAHYEQYNGIYPTFTFRTESDATLFFLRWNESAVL